MLEVVGRLAGAAGLDVIAEVVEGYGDLAARLVDPCADLGGLVDGDAGGYDYGSGDDDACSEGVVRSSRRGTVRRCRAHAGSCKQVDKGMQYKEALLRAMWTPTDMHGAGATYLWLVARAWLRTSAVMTS